MAIRYSKITHRNGTIYSTGKGNKILRQGDTLFVTHEAYQRMIHIPWMAIDEADFVEFCKDEYLPEGPANRPKF